MIQCTFSSVCILMRMTLWVGHLRAAMLIQPSPLWLYLYMDARSFGNVAAWIHGNTETPMHWYTDTRITRITRIHGCTDTWMHGCLDICMMCDVWCTMYVWCRVQGWSSLPRYGYIYITCSMYLAGCMDTWMCAVKLQMAKDPPHKTPVFCNRHCLNVCDQIRKTQAEPPWIVAQRLLSALTIPGFT